MYLYCACCIDSLGNPRAAFLLAKDPDEATGKINPYLPEGGKLTQLFSVCNADLMSLNRNKLYKLLSERDQIKFTADTILELADIQHELIYSLQKTVIELQEQVKRLQAHIAENQK